MIKLLRVILLAGFGLSSLYTVAHSADIAMQHRHVKASCLPKKLQNILTEISNRTGKKIVITSGLRHKAGSKNSLHRKCMAVDFRIKGVPPGKMRQIVRSIPNVGGFGSYSRKPGLYHVDIGPVRTWSY